MTTFEEALAHADVPGTSSRKLSGGWDRQHVTDGKVLCVLAAEARRLYEDNRRLADDVLERLNHDVAAINKQLAEENARLSDQLLIRDMQLSTVKELLAQAEAKCDELRARWDRAETAREELEKLLEQTRGNATKRVDDDKKPTFESIEIDLNSSETAVATNQLDVDWALEQVAKPGWHPVTETLLAEEVMRLRAAVASAKTRDEREVDSMVNSRVVERLARSMHQTRVTSVLPPERWPEHGWESLSDEQRASWVIKAAEHCK